MTINAGTRRDTCYLIGKRASLLTAGEAATAWSVLSQHLIQMGEIDLPKFKHLLAAIRTATVQGKRVRTRS